MHNLFKVSFLAVVFALLVAAAPVTETAAGTWTASFDSYSGSQKYTWELTTDGDKLTGKVISENGEQQIREGSVKGNKVSWTELVTADGTRTRMKYEGTLEGDKLKLTRTPIDPSVQNATGGFGGPDFGPGGFGGPVGGDSATAKRAK